MGTLRTQFFEAFRKLEEAAEVIRSLTEKIRAEIGEEQSVPLFRSKEELLSRLFPAGLPPEKLNDALRKTEGAINGNRRHPRISLMQEVEYEGEAGRSFNRLTDISEGGIFIDTAAPFPPGTIVRVKFRLPNSEEPIVATAEVRYAQKELGMGLKFLSLKPEDRGKIRELVERASAQKGAEGQMYRRSSRVTVKIPVTLKGTERDGTSFEQPATVILLSKYGACVLAQRDLAVGTMLFLYTPKGLEFKASVVWVGNGQVGIQCRGLAQAFGFHFY